MIFCQVCTARNTLGREFCSKCGAKLLVASGAMSFDSSMALLDEHFLERISALEYAVTRLNERVDSLVETIERVAASNFIDHAMIETLTESLKSVGINLTNLEAEWRKRVDSRILETEEVDRLGTRMQRILALYHGSDREQFTGWIEKSYDLIVADRASEGLHFLQMAFDPNPANYELGMVLGELFFHSKEYASSIKYLSRVLEIRPNHFEATLLMGVLKLRTGNPREAQGLLEAALVLNDNSSAAHATLGSLFAEVGNKKEALKHLNISLELKPSAPVHFMLSAIYSREGQQKRAIQHLKWATELDPDFDEAFYQLGLLCLEVNWLRKAQKCFKTAQALNPRESRYRKRLRSFSEETTGPDKLNRLIRDELRLVNGWTSKRSK